MKHASLIFPHQLYQNHPAIKDDHLVVLIEDSLFFYDKQYPCKFHKQKLILHRASMKAYEASISKNHQVAYYEYVAEQTLNDIIKKLSDQGVETIHVVDPTDFILEKRIKKAAQKNELTITWYESPNFVTPIEVIKAHFKNAKHYSMTPFYIQQRKRLEILIDSDQKPIGGKWTFDTDNRKKLPKDIAIPPVPQYGNNDFVDEAKHYVETHFSDHPGEIDAFRYPINHTEAKEWLEDFLTHRLTSFGPYEDAFESDQDFLFHSLLTAPLNIGLLDPKDIVKKTLDYADKHDISLNSLEGFIRQIIGWREFMRAIYVLEGVKERTSNFWRHTNKLPPSFWKENTGIDPVDATIKRVNKHCYSHHIERLMVMGNFMLLCEIDPNDIYTWFMEMYIDAYDWVMVPNVYGMSQYADGGLITTKPYISSSNYIRKMSHYKQGDWCNIWDGLYWRFIDKHKDFFKKNPRLSMMAIQLQKMDKEKLQKHMKNAEKFLKTLSN